MQKKYIKNGKARPPVLNSTHTLFQLSSVRFGAAVREMTRQNAWDDIIALLEPRLLRHRNEHWVHLNLAVAFFEKQDAIESIEYITNAAKLEGDCPFVGFLFGRINIQFERYHEAIGEFRAIIKYGIPDITHHECCMNHDAAKNLVNECYYFLAIAYTRIGRYDRAKKTMSKYHPPESVMRRLCWELLAPPA